MDTNHDNIIIISYVTLTVFSNLNDLIHCPDLDPGMRCRMEQKPRLTINRKSHAVVLNGFYFPRLLQNNTFDYHPPGQKWVFLEWESPFR